MQRNLKIVRNAKNPYLHAFTEAWSHDLASVPVTATLKIQFSPEIYRM